MDNNFTIKRAKLVKIAIKLINFKTAIFSELTQPTKNLDDRRRDVIGNLDSRLKYA